MFCPKCHSLLKTSKGVSSCSCGYKTKTKQVMKEVILPSKDTVVFDGINPFATENHICPKCGFSKAVLIESQIAIRETWNNSEANKSSFVCGKCGFKDFIE